MKKTGVYLREKKTRGERIAMLTCYDYPTALWEDETGVDVVFVGDSVGTNVLGYTSVKEVTLEDIIHHLKAVRRGVREAYLLADLPFRTYESPEDALHNARTLIEHGADGVKLEGFKPEIIKHLSSHGLEVCAHLGLNPQTHARHSLQATTADSAVQLVRESLALQAAGAMLLVYELVPEEVARKATEVLQIPTIGIGAGRFTDGQVLVVVDILGINAFNLRHNRRYEEFRRRGVAALRRYVAEVQNGHFPGEQNVKHLAAAEVELFARSMRESARGAAADAATGGPT